MLLGSGIQLRKPQSGLFHLMSGCGQLAFREFCLVAELGETGGVARTLLITLAVGRGEIGLEINGTSAGLGKFSGSIFELLGEVSKLALVLGGFVLVKTLGFAVSLALGFKLVKLLVEIGFACLERLVGGMQRSSAFVELRFTGGKGVLELLLLLVKLLASALQFSALGCDVLRVLRRFGLLGFKLTGLGVE